MPKKTSEIKASIEKIISDVDSGKTPPEKAWPLISNLKDQYLLHHNEQSWHSYIGNKFQYVVRSILNGYAKRIASRRGYSGLRVLSGHDAEKKQYEELGRKLLVKYGEFFLLPDTDVVIAWWDEKDPWHSAPLAIVSCKTSLRERIGQACYWKLKLVSSDVTKDVKVYLATVDNDDDFAIIEDKKSKKRYAGKHRNRVIAEYELDGIYILKEEFPERWESKKVKKMEKIVDDIVELLKNIGVS